MHYAFKFFFCKFILPIVEIKSVMLPSISSEANVPTICLVVKVSHKGGRSVCKDALLIHKMLGKFGEVLELAKVVLLGFLDLGVIPSKDIAISQPRLPREMGSGVVILSLDFFSGDFGLVGHTRGIMPKVDKSTRVKMNYFQ